MQSFTHTFNILLSIGTLVTLGLSIALFYLYFFKKSTYVQYQKTYGILFIVLFSGVATLASLVYSLVIGFPPCDLCWYQRIFIYGVFFMSITAWCKKATLSLIAPYLKTFIVVGFIIALYHTIVYYVGINPIPCSTEVSCTARYVYEFGFVTIPLMSLATFIFLGAWLLPHTQE